MKTIAGNILFTDAYDQGFYRHTLWGFPDPEGLATGSFEKCINKMLDNLKYALKEYPEGFTKEAKALIKQNPTYQESPSSVTHSEASQESSFLHLLAGALDADIECIVFTTETAQENEGKAMDMLEWMMFAETPNITLEHLQEEFSITSADYARIHSIPIGTHLKRKTSLIMSVTVASDGWVLEEGGYIRDGLVGNMFSRGYWYDYIEITADNTHMTIYMTDGDIYTAEYVKKKKPRRREQEWVFSENNPECAQEYEIVSPKNIWKLELLG